MRILVTGADGQVGTALAGIDPRGHTLCCEARSTFDLRDSAQMAAALDRLQPNWVINTAAYTAVDQAELEPDQALAVNGTAVGELTGLCAERGIGLLHLSTDYVFAGDASEPYLPGDPPDPQNVYGRSKLAGEQAVLSRCDRSLVLRVSWVYGATGANFVRTMLRLAAERTELSVVSDQIGTPCSALDVAEACLDLLEAAERSAVAGSALAASAGPAPGSDDRIWQLATSPVTSWHGFAAEIFAQAQAAGLLERVPTLQAIDSAAYPTRASRPAYSVLDDSALVELRRGRRPQWPESLRQVLAALSG